MSESRGSALAMPGSMMFRLVASYALLIAGLMGAITITFYLGTIGVLSSNVNDRLYAVSNRLVQTFGASGQDGLRLEIGRLLSDGLDSDTEVYMLTEPDGRVVAGNLSFWRSDAVLSDSFTETEVVRNGRPSRSRLYRRTLPDGEVLVVGRDMRDQRQLATLLTRTLEVGGGVALIFAIGGALLIRGQLQRRIGLIRMTASRIESGDLSLRIPVTGKEDEFTRLNRDINLMLDRIQHLMEGVRHISTAIAHDLRTPLTRVRAHLDEAIQPGRSERDAVVAAGYAIERIDDLIGMFEKVLLIAEAESGARRQSFEPIALKPILGEVAEFYDAVAEERGVTLNVELRGNPVTLGDRHLLAGAVANLVDNALKYAGKGATIRLRATESRDGISVDVLDNGPGVPVDERERVVERFYRADTARNQPGSGLGLSLVAAVASLHHGSLSLHDAGPGLLARIMLPLSR